MWIIIATLVFDSNAMLGLLPIIFLIAPLPLAGLFMQQRRMCEIVFPASEHVLDARFRKLLLPRTVTSLVLEIVFALSVVLFQAGACMAVVAVMVTAAALFSILSTIRFLSLPEASRLRKEFAKECTETIGQLAPQVLFYHSGPSDSLYQYRMWAPILDKLSLRVLVVFRESGYLSEITPAAHSTVFIRRFDHLYQVIPESVKVVLYAANGTSNINMLRWHLPAEHVFINHGESDKAVNTSYFLTVYSRLFVSGRQAIERFSRCAFTIPQERFVIVGRPQVDSIASGEVVADGRTTLLYAPTWEGWNPQENYSSLETIGLAMIDHLLQQRPDIRIVFKPHPFCGKNRPATGAAVRRIGERLAQHPGHLVLDGGGDIMPHLASASLLVTDVSSVAADFLATGKPLIMTDPLSLGADAFRGKFPTAKAAYLLERSLGNLEKILNDALGGDSLLEERQRMFEYSLGGFRGNATKAFDEALVRLAQDVAAKRLALQDV